MAAITPTAPTALDDLTAVAIDLPPGSAVLCEDRGRRHVLDPVDHFYGPLVGLSCPFEVAAVGSVADCVVMYGDCPVPAVVAWAADRLGQATMGVRIGTDGNDSGFAAGKLADCPGLDVARRALGMATPVCRTRVVSMADAVFFHRVLGAIDRLASPRRLSDRRSARPGKHRDHIDPLASPRRLSDGSDATEPERRSGGGPTSANGPGPARAEPCERLGWGEMAALHPLAQGGSLTPAELLERRTAFDRAHTWSSLRRSASLQGSDEPMVAPGLTPAVAAWLDDGTFARWVLAGLGDTDAARAEVATIPHPPCQRPGSSPCR